MNEQLKILYKQIKEHKVNHEDAAKQLKLLKIQHSQKIDISSNLSHEQNIISEAYVYDEPFLRDHTVYDEQVLIGMTHGSLAINAFFRLFPEENNVHLHKLNFIKPIVVKKGQKVEVVVKTVQQGAGIDFSVQYRHIPSTPWEITATGNLQKTRFEDKAINIEYVKNSLQEIPNFDRIYAANPVLSLGDSFKTVTHLYTDKKQVLARVALSQTLREEQHKYNLHPLIIHSAYLASAPLFEHSLSSAKTPLHSFKLSQQGMENTKDGFLPFGIKDIHFRKTNGLDHCWVLARLVKNSEEMAIFDADVISDESQLMAHFSGCSMKRLRAARQTPAKNHNFQDSAETQQPNTETSISDEKDWPEMDQRVDVSNNTTGLPGRIQQYVTGKIGQIAPEHSSLSDVNANFMDMGLESFQLIAITNEIEQETQIELFPTIFFEYPNLKELTEFFVREHHDTFGQLLENASPQPEASNKPVLQNQDFALLTSPASAVPAPRRPHPDHDIAVIGMHCMFAGASNVDQFWHNLREQKDLIREIPRDHWDYRPWFDENPRAKNTTYCKWGSFIDNVTMFDAEFFNISPREAEWMDPQLRLLLQSMYATGEDAGYINQLRGTDTGVFVGVCSHDYADRIAELNLPIDPYIGTGMSPAVCANRVSFYFDLTGPSIAFNTACSSALFALHAACQALRNQECALAFVGGVNLLLSSWHYRYFSSIGALSPTGRCHTFDKAADGYVPGECVGTILLKPLGQAEMDGDHIEAVIKGSAALHGGYTPSLTAPSVSGEENVIMKAWENAGIAPETLSYIEAHGTGTKLGDPIEITSLTKAFQRFTGKEHFCAIGSVKANVGHTEGAAGIAGLLKVILQMRSKQIPAMPQFQTLNPYITLDKSALYLNRELEEWNSPAGAPRRAGVSSFGFSGAYAHAVLEEYIPPQTQDTKHKTLPAIIVLSAKDENCLREQVQHLLAAIREQQFSDSDLANIAYTLQVGREAMEERLALIVRSVKELEGKLRSFLEGQEDIEALYRGQVKRNQGILALFTADEELQEAIHKWFQRRKLTKLTDLWTRGTTVDWDKLYNAPKPRRLSLPTYPFAKEHYWIDDLRLKPVLSEVEGIDDCRPDQSTIINHQSSIQRLHPLLHQNMSSLSKLCFRSIFTGQEFFLKDHVVQGQPMLPGVAYLEIARAAVEQIAGTLTDGQTRIRLKNVVWIRPLTVGNQPVQVHIGLSPEENGEISFEIFGEYPDIEPVVHCQGFAVLVPVEEIPTSNLEVLQAECQQSNLSSLQCYDAFRTVGFAYGPSYQAIEKVYVGKKQVLAQLSLPPFLSETQEQFVLHPSLMDAALQAAIGFILGSSDSNRSTAGKLSLPFALQELDIFKPCTASMWALIRVSGDSTNGKVQKSNIEMCDQTGAICVRMTGFSSRTLKGARPTNHIQNTLPSKDINVSPSGTIMFTPVWDVLSFEQCRLFPSQHKRVAIVGGTQDSIAALRQLFPQAVVLNIQAGDTIETIERALETSDAIDHLLWIAPQSPEEPLTMEETIDAQQQGVLACFRLMKALLRAGYGPGELNLIVITTGTLPICPNEAVNPTHASLHGLIGSMAKEYPHWKIRLIDLEAGCEWPLTEMFTLPLDPQGNVWGYRGGQWYRQRALPCQCPPLKQTAYRSGGVYVVIGGAGGIGTVWSEYLIRRYQAQIIWLGRSQKNAAIQSKSDRLAALGPAPHYIVADASDLNALQSAYQEIKQRYTRIHGVIHSAIVLADHSLTMMDAEDFQAVLSTKINVSVRLAQVFRQENLDFVLFFSSINAFFKAAGQSNYTSGCTFMDAFAHQLAHEWSCAVKVINWGYWGSVGIVASQEYQERMAQAGIGSLEPPEAMEALERFLASPLNQIGLLKIIRPQDMATMNSETGVQNLDFEEMITIYPDPITSILQRIQGHIPAQDSQIQRLKSEKDLHQKRLDKLLCRLLWEQLRSSGMFTEKTHTFIDLKTTIGLRDVYERWFEESLAVLVRNHYLNYGGESYSVLDTGLQIRDAGWDEWDRQKEVWLKNPNLNAQIELIETTLRALPDILTGKQLATDIVFPNSSLKLVEGIYRYDPLADYFNNALTDTVAAYIRERLQQDPAAHIRIFEIGAGTGGTSAKVFQKIQPYQTHIQEYCYTDISKAFLLHAEQTYGHQYPYLIYHIFDVEMPPAGQQIDPGGYDLVIAASVLHATKGIRNTLRNTKALLRPNGVLLLNELSGNALFSHLTFGLLEGWWLYEDSALRIPGCPALSPETWQMVLQQEGFRWIYFPAHTAHELGQQIIVAESDGVVRQPRKAKRADRETLRNSEIEKEEKAEVGMLREAMEQERRNTEVSDQMVEDYVRTVIREHVADALKAEKKRIQNDRSFSEYGVDSILTIHLVQELNQTLKIELDNTSLFDYSTVNKLTRYIVLQYGSSVSSWLPDREHQFPSWEGQGVGKKGSQQSDTPEPTPTSSQEGNLADSQRKNLHLKTPTPAHHHDAIAIIGMSGRFARSKNVNEFWEHLSQGTDLVETISRWDLSEYDSDFSHDQTTSLPTGSFLEDIECFDPLFFNISGLEATYMDPQQRCFLEEAWKASEDAGYAGDGLQGRLCGVYVGCDSGDYQRLLQETPPAQAFWGNASSVTPARIAYYLNLQGPAVAIDTACSSSLVAIHLACQGLWMKETELALAGGVFIQSTPAFYLAAYRAGMLSPKGRCFTFDERADGFVPSEGVGVVVLKRLHDAVTDGDHIYGVIRGSGINQDGATNGITAPSARSQERLERTVYERFHIDPAQIQMVEAHGTGTKLGDPIEFAALTRAFRKDTDKKEYCALGSIKTNIGHAATAAGVAGVIKILLALQHKQIPPSLHFESGNPNIRFAGSPFYVNTRLQKWEVEPETTRCAAISSFGFSGTNAHLVIGEASPLERKHRGKPGYIIVVSARTREQLRRQVKQLAAYCEHTSRIDCGNLSYTLFVGRKHFSHRLACIVQHQKELLTLLKTWLNKGKISQIYESEADEHYHRENSSLKSYGNHCIQQCHTTNQGNQYLEHLKTIVELYSQGYGLDFDQLFVNDDYCRISLPTYPFAREHYWINEQVEMINEQVEMINEQVWLLLGSSWEEKAIQQGITTPEYARHTVVLCEMDDILKESSVVVAAPSFKRELRCAPLDEVHCFTLHARGEEIDERFQRYAIQIFEKIQHLLTTKHQGKVLFQMVFPAQDEQQLFSGLSGLLKTARLENPQFIGQVIGVDSLKDASELIERLHENSRSPEDMDIRYRAGRRLIAGWTEVEVSQDKVRIPWKDQGVYLITGGAGGLGRIFSQEIAQQTQDATLILAGRSPLNEDTSVHLQKLKALGARVDYQQVDVTDKQAIVSLVQRIRQDFGSLQGIIHSAGVIRDNFIIKKIQEELKDVLAPKVSGIVNLDHASKDTGLDFFVLFSSTVGTMGNIGQADYAAANAFLDAYAEYRNSLMTSNQRQGYTLSINWPLWQKGGMHVDETAVKRLEQNTKLTTLPTSAGIRAFYRSFSSQQSQVLVLEGNTENIAMPEAIAVPAMPENLLQEKAVRYFEKLLSSEIKLPPDQIDANAAMEKYGIDSIMVLDLTKRLELTFGSLPKTLFFEYQTIRELTGYFLEFYREQLTALLGIEDDIAASPPKVNDATIVTAPAPEAIHRPPRLGTTSSSLDSQQGQTTNNSDIAIIGLAGRYPQAGNIEEYWRNLRDGRDCIIEIPSDRWDYSVYFDSDKNTPGKTYSKWGGFLDDVTLFDPGFFNISPREAMLMDPQERLFLECAYETVEDAGYTRQTLELYESSGLAGNVGVFTGVMYEEYQLYSGQVSPQGQAFALPGNPSSVANRVSYWGNFAGPSLTVDTMCSSSLTAIHLACRSLQQGECRMAIAGGVNVSIHPNKYLLLGQSKFASSKGRCESFGQGGDGYVPGEGVGAVLLKPLSQAIAEGDHIYGIIKASAINHGGKTNGYTVPNPNAQAKVIGQGLKAAGVNPRAISYLEAHGTGTSLGDPIEIAGLTKAFRDYTQDTQFCAIGSVKSNIGHCESAAGIAGVTKVLLQLKYHQLAPSLHSTVLNSNIDFSTTPFVVQQELTDWTRPVLENNGENREYPRIAGISSFGAGGSNAHIVIEEYLPPVNQQSTLRQAQDTAINNQQSIIVLSAKNDRQLREQIHRLWTAIREQPFSDSDLKDMAYTLQMGREALEERFAVLVSSLKELEEKLTAFMDGQESVEDLYRGQVKGTKNLLALFASDAEMTHTLDVWIAKQEYSKLLELWVNGLMFDWNRIYDRVPLHRISLPTYPFAKERYWAPEIITRAFDKNTGSAAVPPVGTPISLSAARAGWKPAFPGTDKPRDVVLSPLSDADMKSSEQQVLPTPPANIFPSTKSVITLPHATVETGAKTPDSIGFSLESLREELCTSLADALYLKRSGIDPEKTFIELGVDSIIGVEWIRAINKKYELSIPVTKIYDYPTIYEFAEFLTQEFKKQRTFASEGTATSRQDAVSGNAGFQPAPAADKDVDVPMLESTVLTSGADRKEPGSTQLGQSQKKIPELGEHYGLVLSAPQTLDELALHQWIVSDPQPDEVTIQVRASAINFPDTMCAAGLYPTLPAYPFVPGLEVSGIVSRVGNQVSEFAPGDEVIALTGPQMGGHAAFVNVPSVNIIGKPPELSFEDACSLPVVFGTVAYAFDIGRLAPKEHVLIHTATGGCGLMAIQFARLQQCVIYGTSSRAEKLALLRRLEIPYVMNYRTSDFAQEIQRLSNQRGVDVVFNTLSGDGIQQGLNCLAPSGRYLELAVHALKTSPKLDLSHLVRNQALYSIDLRRLGHRQGGGGKALLALMLSMLQAEQIVPLVSRIYPVRQIVDAFAFVAQGQHIGKVVISHTHSTMLDLTEQCLQRILDQKRRCEPGNTDIPVGRTYKNTDFQPVHVANKDVGNTRQEGIAIIGMSGQFPKARDLMEFWDNIAQGRDCIAEIPATRWPLEEYYDPNPAILGKTYSKWMGLVDEADRFDPLFFNISPAEAEVIDPQQRLFLEHCWRCLEDAGVNSASVSGSRCGVFVGCGASGYGHSFNHELTAQGLMGASMSILSARIAYFLNLQGPCLAIDTACSSSLVALAEACNSLLLQTSDLALAGGVCVLPGPGMHIMTSKAGMLSKDGRCFTFDARANGFVPGEGVGVILVKRFADARRDHDQIYGVIRGWGINQDGKTNGITAPSVKSQIRLEKEIYDGFGIHPDTISLVEAHGTGTALGDPIEVEALTESFRAYTDRKRYCALGSVKSNIGHLMTAAGIAGVMKVVLALQRRMLPPTIHFETLNEHITLEESPFYINTELQPWEAVSELPRRTAVSSFGFSGTNAHLVIEEYLPASDAVSTPVSLTSNTPILLILSAKSQKQLHLYAANMKRYLESSEDLNLIEMAYTLQTGREAMDYRLACVADSREVLLKKLEGFLNNDSGTDVLTAQVKKSKNGVTVFEADEDAHALLQLWIQKRKLQPIAELWVNGISIEWKQLYGEITPRRISLPTYPFARKRYWIPASENIVPNHQSTIINQQSSIQRFHPLLHQNTSDLSQQRFSSTFTGQEFFLKDHVVQGQPMLPGVAYLEMARAAVEQAAGRLTDDHTGIRLKNVVWIRPLIVRKQPAQVHIGLFPGENGEIGFEIYSEPAFMPNPGCPSGHRVFEIGTTTHPVTRFARQPGCQDTKPVVYCQGCAVLWPMTEVPALNLDTLQAECQQSSLSSLQCYDAFRSMGLDYGPGHQGLGKMYVGEGQVLAQLSLPSSVSESQDQFGLHPSLMDAALQASIGLMRSSIPDSSFTPALPFALQELDIFGNCTASMWALIRDSEGCQAGDAMQNIDIDLCDADGRIVIRITRLSSRVLEKEKVAEKTLVESDFPLVSDHESLQEEGQDIQDVLREKAIHYFKTLLSSAIKLPVNRIDADAPLEQYGIDSIMVVQLTAQLEASFGSLPKTLLFEYQNINELSGYFLEAYQEQLIRLLEIGEGTQVPVENLNDAAKLVNVSPKSRRHSPFTSFVRDTRKEKAVGALDIAIIGLSGRYPQSRTIQEFWHNLRSGKNCITEIPPERWDHSLYFDADKNTLGKTYSKWGGFLDGADRFDPLFFNISPREAHIMDPQERVFLECVFQTLEDAGYTRSTLNRPKSSDKRQSLRRRSGQALIDKPNVGVYVGVMYEEYQLYAVSESTAGMASVLPGNPSSIANRVSYCCNFHGPSMAVDTMCSSSLTTIHLACNSLQLGECDTALAGGVNLSIHPHKYLLLAQGRFASSKGRCESFGQGGDGYVPGEGVGAVLLKPLSQAVADGDHIYGIIKGSALNHGGKTNGYTVPNPHAQHNVIDRVLQQTGIDPRSISYIEAHGTGTSLGDPIEIRGLTTAFRQYTQENQFCAIGSAKSNIGHCESAAGIAGVTKVLLQLKYRQLVPSLHSNVLNPNIDFSTTPFFVQQELSEWTRPTLEINGTVKEYPRIAGISSFGAGGSNAHVIIEEYLPPQPQITPHNTHTPAIIVLSAKHEEQLREQAQQLLNAIREEHFSEHDLTDIAYTLQIGREAMGERLAMIVRSLRELEEKLKRFVERQNDIEAVYRGQVKGNSETLDMFRGDEEFQDTVDKWIQRKKYEKLVKLWVNGLIVDWNTLYGAVKPGRISLPTYPFNRERYWILASEQLAPNPFDAAQESLTSHISHLTSQTLHPLLNKNSSEKRSDIGILMFHPEWHEKAIAPVVSSPTYAHHVVILCEPDEGVAENIAAHRDGVRVLSLKCEETDRGLPEIETRFTIYALQLFEAIRNILQEKPANKVFVQIVISSKGEGQVFYGFSGFLKTAQLENPQIIGQVIGIAEDWNRIEDILVENSRCQDDQDIRYEHGTRLVSDWRELKVSQQELSIPYQDRGVYLITGGAGGLGFIFAREMTRQVEHATVILTGRALLKEEKKTIMKALETAGVRIEYRQTDVTDNEAVASLIQSICTEFGRLNGIIHSAGVIQDNFIINKSTQEFQEVLAPKVAGVVNLDQASKDVSLDFFLVFSSLAGAFGNPGQADYAAANAFLDAYATYRHELVLAHQRQGRTLSINWPLWQEGGMQVDDAIVTMMMQRTGMMPMPTENGIRAFYQAVEANRRSSVSQVIVLEGELTRMKHTLIPRIPAVAPQGGSSFYSVPETTATTQEVITAIIANITGISVDQLDPDARWDEMGIDSIMSMQLIQGIESQFGVQMYPAELIEHDTLSKLARFLEHEVKEKGELTPQPPLLESEGEEEHNAVGVSAVPENAGVQPARSADKDVGVLRARPLIYILSTPRAGSTLLRVMLDGHSQIFAPPELHLLPFATLQERASALQANNQSYLQEGLVQAVAELAHLSIDETQQRIQSWQADERSVKDIYQWLRTSANGRYVVDKSPSYAIDQSILARAEQISANAFYIHLIRHPLAVMESFVRNRFGKLLRIGDEDPWKFAGRMWHTYNANIETFLANIPSERRVQVDYETLVSQPKEVMQHVCEALGLDVEEAMLEPYKGERMTGGLHTESLPIGDINFHSHHTIESSYAAVWQQHLDKTQLLDEACVNLAQTYHYRFDISIKHGMTPAQESFLKRFGSDPVWHIVQRLNFQLDDSLNKSLFEQSLNRIVQTHAALRQVFVHEEGVWYQKESEPQDLNVVYKNVHGLNTHARQKEMNLMEAELHNRLDLREAGTIACGILELDATRYCVIVVAHHLVADGVSMAKICQELFANYHHPEQLQTAITPDCRIYDYIAETETIFTESVLSKALKLWESHIPQSAMTIPLNRKIASGKTGDVSSEREYRLKRSWEQIFPGIKQSSKQSFFTFSAALYRCVSEWTDTETPVIVHRLHRRNIGFNKDYSDVVGFFAGDVPLKLANNPQEILAEMAQRFKECFEQIPNGGVSYEILANHGSVPQVHDICPVRLNYQPFAVAFDEMETETHLFESATHERLYFLDCIVRMNRTECLLIVRYSKHCHYNATIQEFVQRWIEIMKNNDCQE